MARADHSVARDFSRALRSRGFLCLSIKGKLKIARGKSDRPKRAARCTSPDSVDTNGDPRRIHDIVQLALFTNNARLSPCDRMQMKYSVFLIFMCISQDNVILVVRLPFSENESVNRYENKIS